jgi:hypothetical protein
MVVFLQPKIKIVVCCCTLFSNYHILQEFSKIKIFLNLMLLFVDIFNLFKLLSCFTFKLELI